MICITCVTLADFLAANILEKISMKQSKIKIPSKEIKED
jgi:hypothetical protein